MNAGILPGTGRKKGKSKEKYQRKISNIHVGIPWIKGKKINRIKKNISVGIPWEKGEKNKEKCQISVW